MKYPMKASFILFIHKYQTLKQAFSVRIPYFFGKFPLENGDVLWGRFDQSFFVFGDVLTNLGTF